MLELGHISPRHSTSHGVQQTLEDAGIEFTERDGVCYRSKDIINYNGHDGLLSFIHDIHEIAKSRKDNLLIACRAAPFLGLEKYYADEVVPKKGSVPIRCLTAEVQNHLTTKGCENRLISKQNETAGFFVCGDTYSLVLNNKAPLFRIVMIRSGGVAEDFRKQFGSMWKKAVPLH